MTTTTVRKVPAGEASNADAPRDWDARVRAALAEKRALTHAGVSAMGDEDLVALGNALGVVRRDADRMMAVVAAEQAERSRAKAKKLGLARQRGKGDERGIVSGQTGGSGAEATRLIELGETLRDAEKAQRGDDSGAPQETAPDAPAPMPVFPEVAQAVQDGRLSVEASTAIIRMLKRVSSRVDAAALATAEHDLVSSSRFMRLERLRDLITRTEQRLDALHLEELAKERRDRRFLRIGETPDGMVSINGRLDPENGAPLMAVMHVMVNQHFRLRVRMKEAAKKGESVVVDERTPDQVRADAMGDFARHLQGCDVDVLPHDRARLVVRTSLEDLRKGLGGASIDGLAANLDAGALRRAAASAGIIPQVLGGKSELLDQGVEKRRFTRKQKIALAQRDGGCAMCGAPPSWCDAHHIDYWSHGGLTDLANGVLLCVRCHHDVHRAEWKIDATPTEVWFTPPAEVDPARRRRPGGRRLFDAYPLEPPERSGLPERSESLILPQTTTSPDRGDPNEGSRECALAIPQPYLVGRVEVEPEDVEAAWLDDAGEGFADEAYDDDREVAPATPGASARRRLGEMSARRPGLRGQSRSGPRARARRRRSCATRPPPAPAYTRRQRGGS
ncbi:HNH endonuclease signature motif containing protein [Demequina sp. NBRC 110055]|uniref:HNH endonuclease signature motif containing protein n=1 Tax=Demequina sp. NBRC 110055 TaxID=1570344 RepID=UPI000A01EAAA|nr:HNH endonuclease signature motif containing protein [Demequina sp. NBRC 110055]